MKKLLKFFAVPAILACGLLVGCNNGDMDLDLNVTVSTKAPSLNDPKNLGYGVLLAWDYTQDGNMFRVTRQKKGGSPVLLTPSTSENYWFDAADLNNTFEADVEYTYRVYSVGAKSDGRESSVANYNDGYVVYESYAEKRITLKAEDIKVQNEPLPKIDAEKVSYSFKNGVLKIAFSGDFDRLVAKKFEVTNKATGRKMNAVKFYPNDNIWTARMNDDDDVEEISVAIANADENGYYADSEAETIPSIKNDKDADSVTIADFSATLRDKTVVLLWTTTGKENVAATDFTIQRKGSAADDKYETLTITPTSQTKYDGTKYWTASDSNIEVGKNYTYKVITDDGYELFSVNTKTFIWLDAQYNKDTNTVTLQWNASTDISDFIIYRAEENLLTYGGLDEDKYYDLLKPLEIEIKPLYEKIDDNGNLVNVYTAKDTTVEKNKDYTYIVTSKADGFKVCSVNYAVSTKEQNANGSVSLTATVYDVDGNAQSSSISNVDDYVVLNFDGKENVTYKGFWTTLDNKGDEIKTVVFTFVSDSDGHYTKKFETKDIAENISNPVDFVAVKFTVQSFIDGKYVGEDEQKVSIDVSLTSYCTFTSFSASSSAGDNRGITIVASGKNFTDKIKVTYYQVDGDSILTASSLSWTLLTEGGDSYTVTFLVAKGSYRVCATVPKDSLYDYTAQDSDSITVTIN